MIRMMYIKMFCKRFKYLYGVVYSLSGFYPKYPSCNGQMIIIITMM